MHAITHVIRTSQPPGEIVLRRFPSGDDAARREARVLHALDGLGGLAPQLLSADLYGEKFGEPALLLSRLPGSPNLTPEDPRAWAESLGRALAHVHAQPADPASLSQWLPAAPPVASLAGPAAAAVTAHWNELRSAAAVLTHFDFWSGNVVWHNDAVSGIVDWSGACLAPAGFDVGWCRLDIALLHGAGNAARFLDAYEAAVGAPVEHAALWDLYANARSHDDVVSWSDNYQQLGRSDITSSVLRQRHAEWTQLSLESLANC